MKRSCPASDDLLRDELGELTSNRSAELRAHCDQCGICGSERDRLRGTLGDLRGLPARNSDATPGGSFVAAVVARVRLAEPEPERGRGARSGRGWTGPEVGVGVGVGAMAIAAVVLLGLPGLRLGKRSGLGGVSVDPMGHPGGVFTARGGTARAERLRAEVLLVRDGKLSPVSGQDLRASDAFAVRVTNASERTVHLMAFGRDAAGDVHWLYPSYRDPRTNPRSVAIPGGTKDRVMGELVQPASPAAGPLQLVTVVSLEPLDVKEVEARLSTRKPATPVADLFPGAITIESMARWEANP